MTVQLLSYEIEAAIGTEDGLSALVLESSDVTDGTVVENTNATIDAINRYNICQRSGYRAKPGGLVRDGYGAMVLPEFAEPRHPQDYVRSIVDRPNRGAMRPDDTGREIFISTEITQDDL